MIKTLLAFALLLLCSGCTYVRSEIEHVSHPFAGKPFGPASEEDTLNQANLCFGKEWTTGPKLLWYTENCLGYKLTDGGVYGPDLTYTGRAGAEYRFGSK